MGRIEKAVGRAELGDPRRNERALLLDASIVQGQTSDTNAVSGAGQPAPWGHAMGAYRFFNNEALELPQIYAMVKSSLCELVPLGTRCFVAHDFSVVDDSKHPCRTYSEVQADSPIVLSASVVDYAVELVPDIEAFWGARKAKPAD